MPSDPVLLDSVGQDTDATSLTTTTISPSSNALLIAVITTIRGGGSCTHDSVVTTLSGVTFTKQDDLESTTAFYNRISIWTAQVGSSPGSGTVTGSWSLASNRCCFAVYEITGHNTASPITQTKSGASVGYTLSLTLDSTPDTSACVFGAVLCQTNGATVSPGSNYTEEAEYSSGASLPKNVSEGQYDVTPTSTTVDWSFSIDDSNLKDRVGIAIEIAAADAGVFPFRETFTGSNGDPWDSGRWETVAG